MTERLKRVRGDRFLLERPNGEWEEAFVPFFHARELAEYLPHTEVWTFVPAGRRLMVQDAPGWADGPCWAYWSRKVGDHVFPTPARPDGLDRAILTKLYCDHGVTHITS